MIRSLPVLLASAALVCAWALPAAAAQKATAVPQLDLNRLTGIWFEQARLPFKWEKRCTADGVQIFALGDKDRSFQRGIFCKLESGNLDSLNDDGKQDKSHNGLLKIRHLVLLSKKVAVLAVAPDFSWAVLGSPDHKNLWLLSHEVTANPADLAAMRTAADAAGFRSEKLIPVPHPSGYYRPDAPGAVPVVSHGGPTSPAQP